jgi:SAM-dependent methyltransferase
MPASPGGPLICASPSCAPTATLEPLAAVQGPAGGASSAVEQHRRERIRARTGTLQPLVEIEAAHIKRALRHVPGAIPVAHWLLRMSGKAAYLADVRRASAPDVAERLAFVDDYRRFRSSNDQDGRFPLRWEERFVVHGDRTSSVPFDPHYLYHPAWAARCIARIGPERHVDVSSYLPFVTFISAFVELDYYEFRPTPLTPMDGFSSHAGDLMALPFADGSVPSLSCLHVIEHLGLGRYGDPIDAGADRRAFAELRRSLAPGGNLLIAVPVGEPRIRYNAHRVYSVEMVLSELPGLELHEFALIPQDGSGLVYGDEALALVPRQGSEASAGTGCFWLKAPTDAVDSVS